MLGDGRKGGQFKDRVRLALGRLRLQEAPLAQRFGLLGDDLVQVELGRRVLDYFCGDAFVKWPSVFEASMTWAHTSGLTWQSSRAFSGE